MAIQTILDHLRSMYLTRLHKNYMVWNCLYWYAIDFLEAFCFRGDVYPLFKVMRRTGCKARQYVGRVNMYNCYVYSESSLKREIDNECVGGRVIEVSTVSGGSSD
jgi:hypothetical protein